jgi:plasmid stabilization system protein ParE
MSAYQFTSLAVDDLFEIWSYIASDNVNAANAVEEAVHRACNLIAKTP